MSNIWALDLGTTNSVVAEWYIDQPRTVNLPDLAVAQPLTQTPLIPSAVYVRDARGRRAFVGQQALEENWDGQSPSFAQGFKPFLGRESQRPLARVGHVHFTVRRITAIFLREILGALHLRYRERVRDLTIPSPVDGFETYRAELLRIVQRLGIRFFRTLDEPVAAALGYGLNVAGELTLMVFDFGGGTLDVAVLQTAGLEGMETGRAKIIAKQGLELGGNHVDLWLMEEYCRRTKRPLDDWYWDLKWEAERVKIQASTQGAATFLLPREEPVPFTREELVALMTERGLYRQIQQVLERVLEEAERVGVQKSELEEVLLVGGSTLLPGVRTLLEDEFGPGRLRDWLPFEAVAHGAAVFASGYQVQDFIYHDYALRVYNRETQQYEYPILIPRGTPYPTPPNFVEKYFAPAQTHGEPQTEFELLIYEIGQPTGPQRTLVWREDGGLHIAETGSGDRPAMVCLNEANPTLGRLRPPGEGPAPRLRISFSVSADRWLCVTVHDLLRQVDLMVHQPVVRLR
ncbi:MAG TPA: Hsp70 family protein [Armatimonadetes bacterium]|nr:Hsp70 family protein [Armatimonadota bacterium]